MTSKSSKILAQRTERKERIMKKVTNMLMKKTTESMMRKKSKNTWMILIRWSHQAFHPR
jgi:hypothetical protein